MRYHQVGANRDVLVMSMFEAVDDMRRDSDIIMKRFNFRLKHRHRGIKKRLSTCRFQMSSSKFALYKNRKRDHYILEIYDEHFGKVYGSKVHPGEHLIRMRFHSYRKAFTGWDHERQRFVCRRKDVAYFYRQNPEYRYFGF